MRWRGVFFASSFPIYRVTGSRGPSRGRRRALSVGVGRTPTIHDPRGGALGGRRAGGLRAGMTLAQARAIAPRSATSPRRQGRPPRARGARRFVGEVLADRWDHRRPRARARRDRLRRALRRRGPLARGAAAEASARGYASRWAVASTPAAARAIATHGPNPTFLAAPDADIDAPWAPCFVGNPAGGGGAARGARRDDDRGAPPPAARRARRAGGARGVA